MTIEQTIEVPASRRITLDVPPQIPVGRTIVAFTPAPEAEPTMPLSASKVTLTAEEEALDKKLYSLHAEELNREAEDVFLYQVDIFEKGDPDL